MEYYMKYAILLMFLLPFGVFANEDEDQNDQNADTKAQVIVNDGDEDGYNRAANDLNLGENHDSFFYGLAGYPLNYGSYALGGFPGYYYRGSYPFYNSYCPGMYGAGYGLDGFYGDGFGFDGGFGGFGDGHHHGHMHGMHGGSHHR
jgi:hypothetical protein